MTPFDYVENVFAIEDFMATNALRNISITPLRCPSCDVLWDDDDKCPECRRDSGYSCEAYFSNWGCEVCDGLPGDVYDANGYSETQGVIEFRACSDCYYYAEMGNFGDVVEDDLSDEALTIAFIERLRLDNELNRPFANWVLENGLTIRSYHDLQTLRATFNGISSL